VARYILRRMISMVPVLLIVSMICFGLLYVLPGDPAVAILGENGGNQQGFPANWGSLRESEWWIDATA
jgi:peptide/nickel transport system permease protein